MFASREPGPAAAARRALAVSMGKGMRGGVRRLGLGNGTSLPGAVALAVDPGTLAGLAVQIPRGSVLVTGSNGKGTTCRMLTPR
jgi:lipid II isoglutaminyl synthase (glutamine-hydrolysing)